MKRQNLNTRVFKCGCLREKSIFEADFSVVSAIKKNINNQLHFDCICAEHIKS